MKIIGKHVVKPLLSAATLLCVATTANAKADWVKELSPYIGADAQMRQMSWPQEAGGNLYQKNNVQGTVFGGIGINRYVGVEAGYSVTPFQESKRNILPGTVIFGNPVGASPLNTALMTFQSKWQVKDWHIDILGYLPVSEAHHFDLVGGVGFAKTTIFQTTSLVSGATVASPSSLFNRTFTAKKGMLRLTAGVQHMVSECYGVRILANWVNTSKFNYIQSQENVAGAGAALTTGQWVLTRIKDSWSYGIGAFAKF